MICLPCMFVQASLVIHFADRETRERHNCRVMSREPVHGHLRMNRRDLSYIIINAQCSSKTSLSIDLLPSFCWWSFFKCTSWRYNVHISDLVMRPAGELEAMTPAHTFVECLGVLCPFQQGQQSITELLKCPHICMHACGCTDEPCLPITLPESSS